MKILYIHDLDPRGYSGGAAITDSFFIKALEKAGHEVVWGSQDPIRTINSNSFDLAVICNAKWNAKNYSQDLRKVLTEKEIPWIKHEHDMACKWRALFPMVSRCQRDDCPAKITYGWQYEEATALIYLSPFQEEMHNYWNGFNLKKIPSLITPPYIPYKKFIAVQEHTKREKWSVMLLSGTYDFKGYYSNLHYAMKNSHLNYHNYTRADTFTQDQIATMDKFKLAPMGSLSPDDVPRVMAEHQSFLHKSDGFLPFERVVLEAYFAGCEVIVNENVGATSYKWFGNYNETIDAMDRTREDFVAFLEKVE